MAIAFLLFVVLIGILVLGQYRTHVLQYAYFCRVPLLVGTLLVAFPFVAATVASSMLGNLLVVDAVGMAQVALWAAFAAWTVMYCLTSMIEGIPVRNALPFERTEADKVDPQSRYLKRIVDGVGRLLVGLRGFLLADSRFKRKLRAFGFFAVLALPLIGVIVVRSRGESPLIQLIAIALLPPLIAWFSPVQYVEKKFHHVAGSLEKWFTSKRELTGRRGVLRELGRGVLWFGGDASNALAETQVRGLLFFILIGVVYIGGYFAEKPGGANAMVVPPLGFLLALIIMICLALTFLTYVLDVYRIPLIPVLVAVAYMGFWWADRDHYYELQPPQTDPAYASLDPTDVYNAWRTRHPDNQIVVVTASGGGITAAFWAARVLTGLQNDTNGAFGESTIVISTVSGGSVGGMYFVDRYDSAGSPGPSELNEILDMSGRSSLAATAWGLAYPDLWRAIGITRAGEDRGWAMEQGWRARLSGPDSTISQWRRGVAEGWRPAQVFNATIVESGERLVIAPIRLTKRSTARTPGARDLSEIYPGADIPVATAARLSATFPFVTPVARPPEGHWRDREEYHVADGGYYDNFGVVSAIEFLEAVLPVYEADSVLFLRIDLADFVPPPARGRRGWVYSALGPLLTMMNVRTAAQVARNDIELQLLISRWRGAGIEIVPVNLRLSDPNAPLSWDLTWRQKCQIDSLWWSSSGVRGGREKVKAFFGDTTAVVQQVLDCRSRPQSPR